MLINLLSILSQDGKEETFILPIEMDSFRSGKHKYVISEVFLLGFKDTVF